MSCKYFSVFFVSFPHGSGGVEYLFIGADVVLGFLLFFIGFRTEISSLLILESYFSKDPLRIS
jgi:hypothetical protein